MKLNNESISIIKSLYDILIKDNKKNNNQYLNYIDSILSENINNTNEKKICDFFYEYIDKLYKKINDKDNINNINNINTFYSQELIYNTEENKIRINKILQSRFISHQIREYINTNIEYLYKFTFLIHNKRIYIYIPKFKDIKNSLFKKNLIRDLKYIYIWLSIFIELSSKKCNHELHIYLYRTSVKKTYADKKIELIPDYINSAYSNVCQKKGIIVIYREEEWFKVFIHELFHSFGLHNIYNDSKIINERFQKYLNLNKNTIILIDEVYAEFWARIINCIFHSYLQTNNKKEYYTNYKRCIELEIFFSLIQKEKIYFISNDSNNNNIKQNIINNNFSEYKEETNVFSYYILTSLFMNNYNLILDFFYHSNNNIIESKNTNEYIDKFISIIKEIYDKERNRLTHISNTNMINISQYIKNHKTLRMSIIEN